MEKFLVCREDFSDDAINIGEGATGRVIAAEHLPTHIKCAIKILHSKRLNEDELTHFIRELKIMVKLNHVCILPFLGWTNTAPFWIVTEYMPFRSLYTGLRDYDFLTPTNKSIILYGVSKGMEKLHSLNIIHRDLKSLNILLDEKKYPKISDFGMSKKKTDADNTMTKQMGTPHWMAPEMFENANYNNKVDVYSFGILIWEVVTGQTPFAGLNGVQIAFAVTKNKQRPIFPSDYQEKKLIKLATKCWHQDPNKRPTFAYVSKKLANKKTFFKGANVNDIKAYISMVEKSEQGHMHSRKPVLISPQPDGVNVLKMPEITHPDMFNYLNDFFSKIEHDNAQRQLKIAYSLIANPSIPNDTLNFVIKGITNTIETKPKVMQYYVNSEGYKNLPVSKPSAIDDIFLNLRAITKALPQAINQNFLEFIQPLIIKSPIKVLRILAPNLMLFEQMPNKFDVPDFLIKNAEPFLISCGADYIQTLYYLCANHISFASDRLDVVLGIVQKGLASQDKDTVHSTYYFFCSIVDDKAIIHAQILIGHLQDPEFVDDALSYMIRYPRVVVSVQLFQLLLQLAPTKQEAFAILIQYLYSNSENRRMFVSLGSAWILGPMSLDNKASIATLLCADNQISPYLANFPEMAQLLASMLNNPEYIDITSRMISAIGLSLPFCALLQNSMYFKTYYSMIPTIKDPKVIQQSLKLADQVTRLTLINDLGIFIPYMVQYLEHYDPQITPFALCALCSMCALYQSFKERVQQLDVEKYLTDLQAHSECTQYVQVIIQSLQQV